MSAAILRHPQWQIWFPKPWQLQHSFCWRLFWSWMSQLLLLLSLQPAAAYVYPALCQQRNTAVPWSAMKEHKNAHGSVTASGSSLLSSNYKLWKVPRNLLWRFCAPIYSFWRFWVSHWFSDVLLLAAVLNPSALLLTLYFGWAALAQTCFCRSRQVERTCCGLITKKPLSTASELSFGDLIGGESLHMTQEEAFVWS